ncbi:RicinB lectin 2 domain containing protein [Asbolus verrucosus]|uniref:RicinB lectin 2 domain containing protein n=1 Tax=Asbolus verrucosus TaxID=1661398 RepID=A0A482VVY8_ASBVE|nr:RicinB lectin 2 domain containing protein [Asbolus verrucosus]
MSHWRRKGYVVIRNQKSGLVLDASEYQIKLQHFTGYDVQLWKLEPTVDGKFFIVMSAAPGNFAVDIRRQNFCAGTEIIAYPRHGGANQVFQLQYQQVLANAE